MRTIEVNRLTKHYGRAVALDEVSFRAEAGLVTAFLGPNGAGKSTTMRILLGLDSPTSGAATIGGRTYRRLRAPLREVGALLDARSADPSRSARAHLRSLALTHGIGRARVEEVLEATGIAEAAHRPVRAFSLGMTQRLGLAAALLGDPGVLVLDEPVNGLDPEGVRWLRVFLRSLAGEGRVVLLSSHLMSETAVTADRIVVIGRGRVLADASLEELLATGTSPRIEVVSSRARELAAVLTRDGARVRADGERLSVEGLDAESVGLAAAGAGIAVRSLSAAESSLEDVFLRLTGDAASHRAPTGAPSRAIGLSQKGGDPS